MGSSSAFPSGAGGLVSTIYERHRDRRAPDPSTGAVTILLTQVELGGTGPPTLVRDRWRYAADA